MKLFLKRREKRKAGWMGIDFRSDGVAAAYVRRNGNGAKPTVEWLSLYPVQGGEPASALSRLNKERDSNDYPCSFVLAPDAYQILQIEAPAVPVDELKSAVRWRLRDMIDFHIDDATFDVLTIPGDKGVGGRPGSMFAVVAKNHMISQTQAMFEEAGMDVRVIDIPEMAQRNIAALLETEERAVAMLSVTDDGALFTVTAKGELYTSRRMEVGVRQFLTKDAEHVYERITLEMQRSLDHFDRQHHTVPLGKIVLAVGEDGAGLQDYLSKNVYAPVEQLDLVNVLDFSQVPELNNRRLQQQNLIVIGAALRHEETQL